MNLTVPDRANLRIWLLLATFGGAMLLLAWVDLLFRW
jgi:hypothetical protein